MNTIQRVIKYLAIAFGIFLAITIISGILATALGIATVTLNTDKNEILDFYQESFNVDEVKNLEIDTEVATLYIMPGDSLKVDVSTLVDDVKIKLENDTLMIVENSKNRVGIHDTNDKTTINLSIPNDFKFENANITAGVGKIYLDILNTENLNINFGTGNFQGKYITATNTTFEGGVGNIDIYDSDLGTLNYNAGVGDTYINAKLGNNSVIDSGVGNIELLLEGDKNDYFFDIETGLGNIRLDGQKMKNGIYGDKEARNIKVDGGIGNVEINF